jgi:hypothetical protein
MARSGIRWQQVAPVEHGAWAFLALPLIAGLGHRHTAAAWCAAGLMTACFLAKRPLERVLRGEHRFHGITYTLLSLGAVCGALMIGLGGLQVWPFLFAQGILGAAAWTVGKRWGVRSLGSELFGASALLVGGSTVLAAGGASTLSAVQFGLALAALALPPLVVLRRRLARQAGRPCADASWLPYALTALGLSITVYYWHRGLAYPFLPLWAALLALRVLPIPSPRRAKTLGYAEGLVQLGHLSVALWALGV